MEIETKILITHLVFALILEIGNRNATGFGSDEAAVEYASIVVNLLFILNLLNCVWRVW